MEQALDRAVDVFSQRGYHGTSIGDLARGTELAQGSLYKAFSDKHALFLAALDHYRARRVEGMARAIGAGGTGRERLRRLLAFYAESSQGRQGRQGCLVVESAAELSFFDEDVAERVTTALGRNEALLAGLIREGRKTARWPCISIRQTLPACCCAWCKACAWSARRPPAAGHAGGGGHGAQGAG